MARSRYWSRAWRNGDQHSTGTSGISPRLHNEDDEAERELWLGKKKGWTDDQLAVGFKMTELAVKAAIGRHELWRAQFDNAEVDFEVNRLIIGQSPPTSGQSPHRRNEGDDNRECRARQKRHHAQGGHHATRLKSVEMMKTLMDTTRPRGGGIQFNQQINAAGGQQDGAVSGRGFDYETRLRQIRESKGFPMTLAYPTQNLRMWSRVGSPKNWHRLALRSPKRMTTTRATTRAKSEKLLAKTRH